MEIYSKGNLQSAKVYFSCYFLVSKLSVGVASRKLEQHLYLNNNVDFHKRQNMAVKWSYLRFQNHKL